LKERREALALELGRWRGDRVSEKVEGIVGYLWWDFRGRERSNVMWGCGGKG